MDGSLYFSCLRECITPWDSEIELLGVRMGNKGYAGTPILLGKVGACQSVEPKQGNVALGEVGYLCTWACEETRARGLGAAGGF